ncbi:hypothetical protein CROQUDRAFT_674248 [Cronartium quercuum f. sp. fusiforme G11]|uniref:Uncharacterized protein n=1 Tax=Cronartium quercuum f. sp. fusiforme G11 TaxID=708437 RepID=A0A9P6T6N8_9BASI|nr:hypothetical protein CROQUDRAFT_674248 [Cronartium quercuum f. sp. fusiforme G11]
MDHSLLPSPPPKPDFANRIKIKHQYSELKSRFYELKNRAGFYKNELVEKEAKENKLRSECDLILDQIELIRTRLHAPPIDAQYLEEEPELKRIKRYQTHDPSLPFLFDSDGGDDEVTEEEADGYGEKDEESEEERTDMETASVGSRGTQASVPIPARPLLGTDPDADAEEDADGDEDADADADADADVDAEGEGEEEEDEEEDEDEDGEGEVDDDDDDDDGEEEPPEPTHPYQT